METERPNRRWRWKFATPCRLSLLLPLFVLQLVMKEFWWIRNLSFDSCRFFDLFEKYGGYKTGKLKLKKPKQLQVTISQIKTQFCRFYFVTVSHRVCVSTFVWTAVRILTACYSEPQQEVLDITRQLLAELGQHNDCEIEEKKSKLEQLKTVLEMWVRSELGHPLNN